MLDVVYRFRSTKTLLERKELERHEIYMAPAHKLNDPMEGYKDIVFRGDHVLWENLLRHYLLALVWVMTDFLLSKASLEDPHIPATLADDDLPTDAFRALYVEVCDAFFSQTGPSSLSAKLATLKQPLRRDGLRLVLSLVHMDAVTAVVSIFKKHGLMNGGTVDGLIHSTKQVQAYLDEMRAFDVVLGPFLTDVADDAEVKLETLALVTNHARQTVSLRGLFNIDRGNLDANVRRLNYLFYTFPDRYVDAAVEQLVHPAWRVACFSATCTNASTWAAYGDEHRGVALVFKPQAEQGRSFIPLIGVIGVGMGKGEDSRLIKGNIKGVLERVTYSSQLPEIEFFQSLGNLPRRKLERAWHANRAGERSMLIDNAMSDSEAWRNAYWASFKSVTTTKLEDWKHEEEYRIVRPDSSGLLSDAPCVEYEFSSLVGIVFGMRTSEPHKLEIMKQVWAQCKRTGRKDFKFYQVAYLASKGHLVCL